MKNSILLGFAALALGANLAYAEVPTIIDHVSGDPVLAGRVVELNAQEMVIQSVTGGNATMKLDSRTLVPRDLAIGMMTKSEFKLLEDGDYYATRVVPVRDDDDVAEMTAMLDREDEGESVKNTGYTAENGENVVQPAVADRSMENHNAYYASENGDESAAEEAREDSPKAADRTEDMNEAREKELPQTASNQPLLALLGLTAIMAAGVLALRRRSS